MSKVSSEERANKVAQDLISSLMASDRPFAFDRRALIDALVPLVLDAEAEAFEAGREQGKAEARRIVGAAMSEARLAEIREACAHRAKDGWWLGKAGEDALAHIDYLTCLLMDLQQEQVAYQRGVEDGLTRAVELADAWHAEGVAAPYPQNPSVFELLRQARDRKRAERTGTKDGLDYTNTETA